MTKAQLMEIIDLIFKLISKQIPGSEKKLEETERQVFDIIERNFEETRTLAYDLETFYKEVIKLIASHMTQDEKGRVKHEVTIDTDLLFQKLQNIFETCKGVLE